VCFDVHIFASLSCIHVLCHIILQTIEIFSGDLSIDILVKDLLLKFFDAVYSIVIDIKFNNQFSFSHKAISN